MPLPRFLTRRPAQLLAALLLAGMLVALGRAGEDTLPASAVGSDADALLIVDGVDHDFELETCFVGNDSFVIAGYGNEDGEDFRVLASPSEVELAFGITDQADPVPEESLWLGTDAAVDWSTDGAGVTARFQLVDRLGDETTGHEAELRVDCGATS